MGPTPGGPSDSVHSAPGSPRRPRPPPLWQQAELERLRIQVARGRQGYDDLRRAYDLRQREVEGARRELKKLGRTEKDRGKRLEKLRRTCKEHEAELAKKRRAEEARDRELESVRRELKAANKEVKNLGRSHDTQGKRLDNLQKIMENTKRANSDHERDRTDAQRAVEAANRDLVGELEKMRRAHDDRVKELENLRRAREDSGKEVDTLRRSHEREREDVRRQADTKNKDLVSELLDLVNQLNAHLRDARRVYTDPASATGKKGPPVPGKADAKVSLEKFFGIDGPEVQKAGTALYTEVVLVSNALRDARGRMDARGRELWETKRSLGVRDRDLNEAKRTIVVQDAKQRSRAEDLQAKLEIAQMTLQIQTRKVLKARRALGAEFNGPQRPADNPAPSETAWTERPRRISSDGMAASSSNRHNSIMPQTASDSDLVSMGELRLNSYD